MKTNTSFACHYQRVFWSGWVYFLESWKVSPCANILFKISKNYQWTSEVCSVVSNSFAIPWTAAYQATPSMEFSRQEYWSGLPFPSPVDFPVPDIKSRSPTLQVDVLPSETPGKRKNYNPSKMQQVVHTSVSVNCTGDWNLLSFQRWHWECQYHLLTLNSAQVGRGPGLWPAVCPGPPTASPVTWEDISVLARITQPRAASWSVSHMAHSLQGHEPLLPASTTRPHFLSAFFGFYSPCIF